MENPHQIKLAFYGDDFTGSTDALEFIARAGAKALLFIEPPTAAQLEEFPGLDVIGVAGKTRALNLQQMEAVLMPAFEQLKALGVAQVHYKTCSTFDSSPTVGSIGKAIDCGTAVFKSKFVPVLGGNPLLERYCLFGNLFASMGIGSRGKIYRLDRHPSMAKHPVTPADESDLRLHLGRQTRQEIALIDVVSLDAGIELAAAAITGETVVLIDVLTAEHLNRIGHWLVGLQQQSSPVFSVGASGVEIALGNHWNRTHVLEPVREWTMPGPASPLLVVSGSCSPVTAAQIGWAIANGFEEIIVDPLKIGGVNFSDSAALKKMCDCLSENVNVIVHTGTKSAGNISSEKLGGVLGAMAKYAVENTGVKRVGLSGGDTSSYAARAMEIEAVEMMAPLVSGAPLCRVHSKNRAVNGLQVNFKGGQVGPENYFGILAQGALNG